MRFRTKPLAIADGKIPQEVLRGVVSRNEAVRYNSFKALLQISENQPLVLYQEWDHFIGLLGSRNSYHRSTAVNVIARLVSVDAEGRFEDVFDQYFDLLSDERVITARYLARNVGRIARSKPHLQVRVTEKVLDIDKTHHKQQRQDLIKADIIQSFEEFFEASPDKERILAFVERQLECSSPTTRKAAKGFLSKYGVSANMVNEVGQQNCETGGVCGRTS